MLMPFRLSAEVKTFIGSTTGTWTGQGETPDTGSFTLNYTITYDTDAKTISVTVNNYEKEGNPIGWVEYTNVIIPNPAGGEYAFFGTLYDGKTGTSGSLPINDNDVLTIKFEKPMAGTAVCEISYIVGSEGGEQGETPNPPVDTLPVIEALYLIGEGVSVDGGWAIPTNAKASTSSEGGKYVFENIKLDARNYFQFLVNGKAYTYRLIAGDWYDGGWQEAKNPAISSVGESSARKATYTATRSGVEAPSFTFTAVESGKTYNIIVDASNQDDIKVWVEEYKTEEPPVTGETTVKYYLNGNIFTNYDGTKRELEADDNGTYTLNFTLAHATFNVLKEETNANGDVTSTYYGPYGVTEIDKAGEYRAQVAAENSVWITNGVLCDNNSKVTFTFDPTAPKLIVSVDGQENPEPEVPAYSISKLYLMGDPSEISSLSATWGISENDAVTSENGIFKFENVEVIKTQANLHFGFYSDNNLVKLAADDDMSKEDTAWGNRTHVTLGDSNDKKDSYFITENVTFYPNFLIGEIGKYNIYVDASQANAAKPQVWIEEIKETEPDPETPDLEVDIESLTLIGLENPDYISVGHTPLSWTYQSETTQIPQSGKAIFKGVKINKGAYFQFMVNGSEEAVGDYRISAVGNGDMIFQGLGKDYAIGGELRILENDGQGYRNFLLQDPLENGYYNIVVDYSTGEIKVWLEKVDVPAGDKVGQLFLFGNNLILSSGQEFNNWAPTWAMPGATKVDATTQVFENITIKDNAEFIITYGWEQFEPCIFNGSQISFNGIGEDYAIVGEAGSQNTSFKFNGDGKSYDIYVDVANPVFPVVWITEHQKIEIDPSSISIRIENWEGYLYKFSNKKGTKDFEYVGHPGNNNNDPRYLFKYEPTIKDGQSLETDEDRFEPEPYVTQLKLWINNREMAFDARSVNTLLDLIPGNEFWCENSRMEPGLDYKAIFVVYDPENNTYQALFSSTGIFNTNAPKQKPLNSDKYYITLNSGVVYDALRGTQSGTITVPFSKHHIAQEGYVINLGKEVTVKSRESFTFYVEENGTRLNKGSFLLDNVYVNEAGKKNHGNRGTNASSYIDGSATNPLTFSKLVLLVNDLNDDEPGTYDKYEMYLVDQDNEPTQFYHWGYEVDYVNKNGDGFKYDEETKERIQNNPKLKVWNGNSALWEGIYPTKPSTHPGSFEAGTNAAGNDDSWWYEISGNVYMKEFKPIMSEVPTKGQPSGTTKYGKKTNLYFLDLTTGTGNDIGGIKVRNPQGEGGAKTFDKFNILDNEGYDISNPFQGSQLIYPEEWWCINPDLGFDEDHLDELYEYFGINVDNEGEDYRVMRHTDENGNPKKTFYFPPLDDEVKGMAEVDLTWGVREDQQDADGDGVTIYGITMFKIMGEGYDVYAEEVKQRPLYYLYAHTKKPEARDGKGNLYYDKDMNQPYYEHSAPIYLAVRDADKVFTDKSSKPVEYRPERGYMKKMQDADSGLKFYKMMLSKKQLPGNDDLNYVLADAEGNETIGNFIPKMSNNNSGDNENNPTGGNSEDGNNIFRFVGANGVQTWDSYGDKDRLTPNLWSNYYTSIDDSTDDIVIDQPDAGYFRLVLATNPDAVRYQMLTEDNGILAERDMQYDSMTNPLNVSDEYDVPVATADGMPVETKHDNIWIYPTATVKGNFFWRTPKAAADNISATEKIEVTLTIHDGDDHSKQQIMVFPPITADYNEATDEITFKYTKDGVTYDIPSDKIEIFGEDDAFLLPGEFIFSVELGEIFADPDWKYAVNTVYHYVGNDNQSRPVNKITVEAQDYMTAGIDEVKELKYGSEKNLSERSTYIQGDYKKYLVQLKWLNGEHDFYHGLPRTYKVTAQQVQTNDEEDIKTETPLHNGELAHDGFWMFEGQSTDQYFSAHNNLYYAKDDKGKVYTSGWEIPSGEDFAHIDGTDVDHVRINYTVTPVYHYAVPVEPMYLQVPDNYSFKFNEAPKGGVKTKNNVKAKISSNADDLENFRSYVITGDSASTPIDYRASDGNVSTAVEGVTYDADEVDGPAEYYTLQGVKVSGQLEPGIYIVRKGGKSTKVLIR